MLQNSCFRILVSKFLGTLTNIPLSGPRSLLSSCGQIASASLAVDQADDDVPHDRTPFDQGILITCLCFRLFSRAGKMAPSARGLFRGQGWMKPLHGRERTTRQLVGLV